MQNMGIKTSLVGSVLSFVLVPTQTWAQSGIEALDSPAAADAILSVLSEEEQRPIILPVISAAGPEGNKWVRGLIGHPDWPVQMPFAALMMFTCGADTERAGEPACWARSEAGKDPL